MRSFDSHCFWYVLLLLITINIDVFLSCVWIILSYNPLTFCIKDIWLTFNQISCMQFSRYNIRLTHLTSRLNFYKPMGLSGLEPPTSRLSGVRSNQLSYKPILKSFDFSGDEEIRTLDPLLARQVLSQLSYIPIIWRPPALPHRLQCSTIGRLRLNRRVRDFPSQYYALSVTK